MDTKTFFFNTGVGPGSRSKLYGRQVWRNGTIQIPFTCADVPDNAHFEFACGDDKLQESTYENWIVREILDCGPGGMLSRYAYFSLYGE